jgi:hypothetical protein
MRLCIHFSRILFCSNPVSAELTFYVPTALCLSGNAQTTPRTAARADEQICKFQSAMPLLIPINTFRFSIRPALPVHPLPI